VRFIWATRGRTWGFRFLQDGGQADPFAEYSKAFFGIEHEQEVVSRKGGATALRFSDPDGRRDSAGRLIPHEFVLFGDLTPEINTIQDGIDQVWPSIAEEFDRIWNLPEAPSPND
jgi:hypothetical protein